MGQYYKIITRKSNKTTVYDRSIKGDGDYVMAKLLEHSWWENSTCKAVAASLVDNPTKLCWCGDYAEPDETEALGFDFEQVWGEDCKDSQLDPAPDGFSLDNLAFLVNKDKKLFVDLKQYKADSIKDGWCIFPLSILTSLGNGRGGGDYEGSDMDKVGSWAFDSVYFTNKTPPKSYKKLEVSFKESY